MTSTDDRDTASINGIPKRIAGDYIELQDGRIEQLKDEFAAIQRWSAAWKASAKMHREDELAFEQTIRGLEKDLAEAIAKRKETEMESDDRLAPGEPNSSVEMVMISAADMARLKKLEARRIGQLEAALTTIQEERDEARAVARRLLNDPVYHLRCINRQWEREGYDDLFDADFEEAMELKKVLP